jgi:preprotein translocase subunit SecE
VGTFIRELAHVGIYKRSQGRVTRQVTFAALAVIVALGLLRLSMLMTGTSLVFQFVVPGVLLAASLWVFYRLVNLPVFADFLIAVEAEMNKVSWPSRPELFRSSAVVLVMIFALGFYLALCEFVLWELLKLLGVL